MTAKAHDQNLAELERNFASATPQGRAHIIRRAQRSLPGVVAPDVFERLAKVFEPAPQSLDVVQRIEALAKADAPAAELAQAGIVLHILDYTPHCEPHIEGLLHELENLTPENRMALRPRIERDVLACLDAVPGNALRRQRFLEALDGKRTPYLDHDIEQPGLDRVMEPGIVEGSTEALRSLGAVVLVAQRMFALESCATVDVTTLDLAKQVAHFFESRGFRAAIRDLSAERVQVGIYQPTKPGSFVFDPQRRARERERAKLLHLPRT